MLLCVTDSICVTRMIQAVELHEPSNLFELCESLELSNHANDSGVLGLFDGLKIRAKGNRAEEEGSEWACKGLR